MQTKIAAARSSAWDAPFAFLAQFRRLAFPWLVAFLFAGSAYAAPSISAVSPGMAVVGTAVTVTGSGFGATQGTSTIQFHGTTATPTSWSNTQIVVPVPSGATSGYMVVNVGGVNSNGYSFYGGTSPYITGATPDYVSVGSSITFTGNNFGTS